ncbi:hypothetical protein [Sporomusa acidovorans]|uniref:Acyl carrier protein n=1 Tax=Sporomusa acidovorans (strain ATCC 49682 / DSM 3132 / Mol) TaxID=1123286 RepID=A0ABZ3JAC4_SPOA4|nr:hypothetical protein [Sporomusa acidovorans]OZC15136.1 hypothetical protein SPACI_50480 [Sporomusa acidovorans DSM 3132]SDF44139.1 acyl carrier protein [Sporomusa acidovorans]
MHREKFLNELAEIVEVPVEKLQEDYIFEKWDSLAIIATISLIDELWEISIPGKVLLSVKSVRDILTLIETALLK